MEEKIRIIDELEQKIGGRFLLTALLQKRIRELVAGAPRLVERHRHRPRLLGRRLADVATGRLREVEAMLGGVARVCSELAPERTLERGFSITRDSADKIVREPRQVRAGDRIVTTLAGGVLKSRVEEK